MPEERVFLEIDNLLVKQSTTKGTNFTLVNLVRMLSRFTINVPFSTQDQSDDTVGVPQVVTLRSVTLTNRKLSTTTIQREDN